MKKPLFILAGILIVFICLQSSGVEKQGNAQVQAPATKLAPSPRIESDFGKIPLYFIPNKGQVDGPAAFYVQGRDKTIYFSPDGLTFVLNGSEEPRKEQFEGMPHPAVPEARKARMLGVGEPNEAALRERDLFLGPGAGRGLSVSDSPPSRWVVKLDFLEANPDVVPVSLEESGAVISYFKGRAEDWKTGLSASSRIVYRELWPGIDLHYYGTVDRMKYEFIVHPGAEPSNIKLAYRGAESVTLTAEGRLAVETPEGGFEDDIPVAWQEVDGAQECVPVDYVLAKEQAEIEGREYIIGFEVGEYDKRLPLILDPALIIYSGYIGGTGYDWGMCIDVDRSGNAYIAGGTNSLELSFPVAVGPDLTHNGSYDVFVTKVNASGTALVYCGYIGGLGHDKVYGLAVDGSGNAYVTGETESTESSFPVKVGPDLTYNGEYRDAFVAKVNAAGTALEYCGYIGGSDYDYAYGVAVDSSGNAYITGETRSTEASFPVTVGPDLTHNGGYYDVFVAKVNTSGAGLDYCGYIGGPSYDYSEGGIAVDNLGNAYVTGRTASTSGFPVKVGPDLTHNGYFDVFVAKVNALGTALEYCGYIGGIGEEMGYDIDVDGSGNAYITGVTRSTETSFPVTVGPDLTYNGGYCDVFVAKVNASGTALIYCGYIGGSADDWNNGRSIAVDASGNAYVTGYTQSTEASFPVTVGPDLTHNGVWDAFVAKVNTGGTELVYCGYIGGGSDDMAYGIAVDGSGNAYVTGSSNSIPVRVGPDLTFNGGSDAFVVKIGNNVRVDFSADGQEDILWRYYGTGGRNRIWFLGNIESGAQPMLLADGGMQISVPATMPGVALRARSIEINRVRLISNSKGNLVVADPRDAVSPANWREGVYKAADAGRTGILTPEMGAYLLHPGVQDPGHATAFADPTMAPEGRTEIMAATGVLGGADILSVPDLTWEVMGAGDFNNDGKADVLWRYNGTGGRVRVWYMDGLNVTAGADIGSVSDLDWKIVGTGDFNGDGHIDLLWHHATSGRVRVWYLDGVSIIAGADISTVADLNWKIMGTGDFNDDGHVDLLWRHSVSGRNRVWLMNGTSILSGADLLGVTDQNWQIAGTGDYNGDSHTDVLWRYNGTGGYVYIWYLNGTSWIGTEKLIAVPDLTWRIVSR